MRFRWWLLLGVLSLTGAAWLAAPSVVERLVIARLAAHGLAGATLDVRHVGPFETRIEGFRLPTASADRIIVRYTPVAVFRGDLYSVTLEGLAIAGGVLEAARAAARMEEALRTAAGLRIAHIEFGEAKVTLAAPGGTWNATLRGALSQTPSGALAGAISVVATSVAGAFGGEVTLAADDAGRTAARLRVREAVLRLPGLTLESITGELAVARSTAPLPRIDIDLEMGGRAADGGGLERARLRLVSEGTTAGASVAGIDLEGRRFTFEAATDVTDEAEGIAFRLSRPGSFSFLDRPVRGAAPLALEARLDPADTPVARLMTDDDGIRIFHALRLTIRPTTLATLVGPTRVEGGLLAMDGGVGPDGARGKSVLRIPRLTAPDARMLAEEVVLTTHWEEGPIRFDLAAARLVSTAEPAWFPTLAATVAGAVAADGIAFAGGLSGDARAELAGEMRRDGTGRARLRLRPVDLAHIGHLSPALAAWATGTGGQLAARGEVTWAAGQLDGSARMLLRDVAATLPFGRVDRVNGVIAWDRLTPAATAGVQTLSVGAVDIGLPLTDGTVSFRLDDGRPTLTGARFEMAGGLVTLAEATLSPPFDRAMLKLEAAGLALGQLAGTSAGEPFSGPIPIAIDRERISIESVGLIAERAHGRPLSGQVATGGAAPSPVADLAERLDRFVRQALDRHRVPEATKRQMEAYGEP